MTARRIALTDFVEFARPDERTALLYFKGQARPFAVLTSGRQHVQTRLTTKRAQVILTDWRPDGLEIGLTWHHPGKEEERHEQRKPNALADGQGD